VSDDHSSAWQKDVRIGPNTPAHGTTVRWTTPTALRQKGFGLNTTGTAMRTASGPIPPNAWKHPEHVVGHVTQYPMNGDPLVNAGRRCAPVNVMAAALMQSTGRMARFAAALRASEPFAQSASALRRELQQFEESMHRQMLSYEQLSRAQDVFYGAENAEAEAEQVFRTALLSSDERDTALLLRLQERLRRKELDVDEAVMLEEALARALGGESVRVRQSSDSGIHRLEDSTDYSIVLHPNALSGQSWAPSDADLQRLLELGALEIERHPLEPSFFGLASLLAQLTAGQTAFVRLGLREGSRTADHFITLGRTGHGVAFVYNAAPGEDDFTLYCGSEAIEQAADFEAQLHRYARRLIREQDGSVPWVTVVRW
jgi:hypothetical protein